MRCHSVDGSHAIRITVFKTYTLGYSSCAVHSAAWPPRRRHLSPAVRPVLPHDAPGVAPIHAADKAQRDLAHAGRDARLRGPDTASVARLERRPVLAPELLADVDEREPLAFIRRRVAQTAAGRLDEAEGGRPAGRGEAARRRRKLAGTVRGREFLGQGDERRVSSARELVLLPGRGGAVPAGSQGKRRRATSAGCIANISGAKRRV